MDNTNNTQQTNEQMVAPPPPRHNPLLDRARLPGQTFGLPSKGIFYTNGELSPGIKDGEVHVYPMTALDEIIIRSPDKLYSGDAIVEVFNRCIPDILKPKELFAKDIDFLMVCLRKVSYGDEFEIKYTHDCENAKEHSYIIPMDPFIRNAKVLDPTTVQGKFTIELDNEQKVRLHPIKYKDVLDIVQASDSESTEDTQDRVIQTLLGIIESVDDITDKGMIKEWINAIPVGWAHKISDAIDDTSDWGPAFTYTITCKDCGKEVKIDAPMNPVSFFI